MIGRHINVALVNGRNPTPLLLQLLFAR